MTSAVITAATLPSAPPSQTAPFLVVSLCADWCGTCHEFRDAFERMAAADGEGTYVWLDIEDDAALAGDIDVENFPTLAVFREGTPVFFGISLPQEGVVKRTLDALKTAPEADVPAEVAELPGMLDARRG